MILEDNNFEDLFNEYLKLAPNKQFIHYWDLPDGFCVKFGDSQINTKLNVRLNGITIGKLKRRVGLDPKIEKNITSLITWRNKKHKIETKFPLSLVNKEYVELYSLMLSEGSYNKGFTLHVPEEDFHLIFINNLKKLFGNKLLITQTVEKGFKKSSAPEKIRHLINIPNYIPRFILNNKEFARIYLRIAFEAESNPRYKILKTGGVNRRIKLSRNIGIDNLIKEKLPYKEGKRIYFGKLKKEYPNLAKEILKNPCSIILGEKLMLKKHFNIDTSLYPEYLRINKTFFRRGKISVKWAMKLHSININKFVREIGFVTKHKKEIANKMLNVNLQRPNYFAFDIMKNVSNNNIFDSHNYTTEMLKHGYKFPRVFLAKYRRKNLIRKVSYCKYKILKVPQQPYNLL